MHHTPTKFQTTVMDMLCTMYAVESSYRSTGKPKQSILLSSKDTEEGRGTWLSHDAPQELIQRLVAECQSRGLFAHALTTAANRPFKTVIKDAYFAYKQRRMGRAILAHRSAKEIVASAEGLEALYAEATRQLAYMSLTTGVGLGEIRRVERFSKFVRLSAKHDLIARALEVPTHGLD